MKTNQTIKDMENADESAKCPIDSPDRHISLTEQTETSYQATVEHLDAYNMI